MSCVPFPFPNSLNSNKSVIGKLAAEIGVQFVAIDPTIHRVSSPAIIGAVTDRQTVIALVTGKIIVI